jgi:hypothetical protein
MSKHFVQFVLFFVAVGILALGVAAWIGVREGETIVPVVEPVVLDEITLPVDEDPNEESELVTLWEIEPGMVAEHGSNPMPVYWDEDRLVLAYENRAAELLEAPSEKAKFLETTDGYEYRQLSSEEAAFYDYRPPALEMPDGTYRRFYYNPQAGGVQAMVSEDGVDFTPLDEVFYEVASEGERDPRYFGVSTFFVDSNGGVTLLYNVTNEKDEIIVNRAYAEDGWNFELTHENVLGGSLPTDNYPDPHTLVRENGEIWLVVMHRTNHKAAPPLERGGTIQAYKSTDEGQTFEYVGQLMAYTDFEEWEVYSLNDPKIMEFPDGTLQMICAAMVEDETSETGFKWVLVQSHE